MSIASRPFRSSLAKMKALALSACALALSGCGLNYVADVPKPSASLLLDNCPPPVLVPDEKTQTSEQVNVERVTVAASRECYRTKFYGLKGFNEGMAK